MYFSTDNSDEKTISQLKFKINTLSEEVQKHQRQARNFTALEQLHTETKEELQRSRELITLLHEKYNNLRVELSMARVDLSKKN